MFGFVDLLQSSGWPRCSLAEKQIKMTKDCCVVGCSNSSKSTPGVSFHRIPAIPARGDADTKAKAKERRERWLAAIHREDMGSLNLKNARVCSDHFTYGMNAAEDIFYELMWHMEI